VGGGVEAVEPGGERGHVDVGVPGQHLPLVGAVVEVEPDPDLDPHPKSCARSVRSAAVTTALGDPRLLPASVSAAASRDRRPLVAAVVVALTGIALRAAVLASSIGDLDSDEAITGLMATRLLDGRFDTFYIGQAYGGSQEAVLAAAAFAVTGPSVLVLKSVVVALTAATALLTWRVGRRVVGERAAALAGALVWVGPPFALWWSTKARGFYGMSSTMALLAILATLRLVERPSRRDAALLGLAVGLGWWASPQSAVVSGAVVLWALATTPRLLRCAPLAVLGALAGAAPWIVFNLRNHWVSLRTPPIGSDATFPERFVELFTQALPRYLGLTDQLTGDWRLGPVSLVAGIALGAAVVAWSIRAVRARDRRAALVAPLVAFPLYFAANPFTAFPEPRYVWVVAPVLALVVADLAVGAAARLGRPSLALALVPLLALASAVALVQLTDEANDRLGVWELVSGDASPLVDALVARGVDHAYADYWVAYKLSFESDERLLATGAQHQRGLDDHTEVLADPRPAYVTFAGEPPAARVRAALAAAGIEAEHLVIGHWEAFLPQADVPVELRERIYAR
jgi:hypothetical protein